MYDAIDDNAGHPLDLEELDPDVMLNATIESFGGDEKKLSASSRALSPELDFSPASHFRIAMLLTRGIQEPAGQRAAL